MLAIDHVTIGCADLEQGASDLHDRLGIVMPPGGKHPGMSTHNRLLRLGDEMFLELLAVDPDAPPPDRPRWFGLDSLQLQQRLLQSPKPIGWVVRTDDIDAVCARSPIDLGRILTLSRGERSWRITVPDDGEMPLKGLLPAFIEWSPGPHPSSGMQFLGPTFRRVILRHPDPRHVTAVTQALGIAGLASVEADKGQGTALCFELEAQDQSLCRFE